MWPDRLKEKRWSRRCRIEGGDNLVGCKAGNRGAVLASIHFGPVETLPYWLRSQGITATTMRTRPPLELKQVTDYQYSLSPPPDVPVFIMAEDLTPFPRLFHFRKILGPGRCLLIMVDPVRGRMMDVPFEGGHFRMATGAIRLAAMTGADLIPCLITETETWQFVVHFGKPVPQGYLGKSPDMQAAGRHLLSEFSKGCAPLSGTSQDEIAPRHLAPG